VLDVLRGFYAMRTLGRRYFASPWHWWEWTGIALLIAAAVCRYQQFRGMRAVELHLEAALGAFADFRAVAVYAQAELGLTALAALVVYTKALHYLAGVPRFGALLRSVARASTHLAPLVLGLAALLGGQSVAFTLAFGTQGHAWRSVGDATMSLYHLLLGATHDSAGPFALRHTNWVLGPLLYAFVVLLFYLVLLRFVLAVVQEAWALEARCIDRNVHTSLVLRQATLTLTLTLALALALTKTSLVLRQAARRQLSALLRPCGRWGRRAAEWLLPTPLEEEVGPARLRARVMARVSVRVRVRVRVRLGQP